MPTGDTNYPPFATTVAHESRRVTVTVKDAKETSDF